MRNSDLPRWYMATWWQIPWHDWWDWILIQLYVTCLEHKIDPSIITTEVKNGELKININWLVSTEFAIEVHKLETQAWFICYKCWNAWLYNPTIPWTLCKYHYILYKIKKLRRKVLLNINPNKYV